MAKEGGARLIGAEPFDREVLEAQEPVLVDFYASWCGPCRALAPTLDALAVELAGRAKVVKLDVDQAPELARRYQVAFIPCPVVFSGGEEADRLVGLAPKHKIAGAVELALAA